MSVKLIAAAKDSWACFWHFDISNIILTDQPTDRQEKIKKDQEDMQIFFSQAHGPKSYIKFFGSRD